MRGELPLPEHVRAFSSSGKLPDPERPKKVIREVFGFAAKRLAKFTNAQLSAAVEYVLCGADWTSGEHGLASNAENKEPDTDDESQSTIIKFSSTGASAVTSAISGVKKAAGVATKGVAMLASSLGQVGGSLGHAASQVANFMRSVQQMGAIGGIMAGAQIAIEYFSKKYVEAVDKMKKAVVDAEAAKERVKQVENTRRAAVGNAKMALVDAERTPIYSR